MCPSNKKLKNKVWNFNIKIAFFAGGASKIVFKKKKNIPFGLIHFHDFLGPQKVKI